jgi:hypothetical protein
MPPRKNKKPENKIVKVVCVGREDQREADLLDDDVIPDTDIDDALKTSLQDRMNDMYHRMNILEASLINLKHEVRSLLAPAPSVLEPSLLKPSVLEPSDPSDPSESELESESNPLEPSDPSDDDSAFDSESESDDPDPDPIQPTTDADHDV